MSDVRAIPIELIRLDGGTQIRACETFQTKVDEYYEAMVRGADFPPLTVFFDGAEYWLADGFHRHGAYNIVMQGMKLPGIEVPCEVLEGTQRDAIMFACGTNAVHGIPRTNADKHNAVKTMLENPLVSHDENGVPWSAREIARICHVSDHTVAKVKAEMASAQMRTCVSYVRNHVVVTQVTCVSAQPDPDEEPEPEPEPNPEDEEPLPPPPDPPAQPGGEVVRFKSRWDYLHDRLKEIDRAITALPGPHVVAEEFPTELAHAMTMDRVLEIQRWWLDFARFWQARQPEFLRVQQRQRDFIQEEFNAKTRP